MFVFICHDIIFFSVGKPEDCLLVRGECWKQLKWTKDCYEDKFLFDNFVLRCGQITMQDVLRPEEKKKKGLFKGIWEEILSAFQKHILNQHDVFFLLSVSLRTVCL